MQNTADKLKATQALLDARSPSFCAAKWHQTTLHLHNGHTHSCHHPRVHKIQESDIARGGTGLHNTQFKKLRRKEMLEGERPKECDYCWRIEDIGETSDRIHKSAAEYSFEAIKDIPTDWDADINPTYMEVSFSSACNMACAYCGPEFSTTWESELAGGGYHLPSGPYNDVGLLKHAGRMPSKTFDQQKYLDAFWEWFPSAYHDLKVFRVTGGEPMMSKHTMAVFEHVAENAHPGLTLAINTNGRHRKFYEHLFDGFFDKVARNCKKLQIFLSEDGSSELNDIVRYMPTRLDTLPRDGRYQHSRYASHFAYFESQFGYNPLEKFAKIEVNIMNAFNAFSPHSFDKWVADIQKAKCVNGDFDFPYVRSPHFMSPLLLREYYAVSLEQMHKQHQDFDFSELSESRFLRLLKYIESGTPHFDQNEALQDLAYFLTLRSDKTQIDFLEKIAQYDENLADFIDNMM